MIMFQFVFWIVGRIGNVTEETRQSDETISEYHTRYSLAYHLLLPVAGLVFVLFHQKTLLNKLLVQIDKNCLSVFCPTFSRRDKLLKWASSRLPLTWSTQSRTLSGGINDLWSDGSLLCTLINTAIPGACPDPHRHWKKSPTHAQAIAYKYFGLAPMFTDEELSYDLTPNLEKNFLEYLNQLQQGITKLLDKSSNINSVSDKFIARGMGLSSGEQHCKSVFYVYQDENSGTTNESTIIIQIRGPFETYGQAVIPPFRDSFFKMPDVKVTNATCDSSTKLHSKMKNLASFLGYHKTHVGNNIVIDITMEDNRAKVTYIPANYGMYDISMIANGELLKGCPFNVHITKSTPGTEELFEIEEKCSIFTYKKRKIISKTIDFVDDKKSLKKLKKNVSSEEEMKHTNDMLKTTSSRLAEHICETVRSKELENRSKKQEDNLSVGEEQIMRRDINCPVIPTIVEEVEEQEIVYHDTEEMKFKEKISEEQSPINNIEKINTVSGIIINNAVLDNERKNQSQIQEDQHGRVDTQIELYKQANVIPDKKSVENNHILNSRKSTTNLDPVPKYKLLSLEDHPRNIVPAKAPETKSSLSEILRENSTQTKDNFNRNHYNEGTDLNCLVLEENKYLLDEIHNELTCKDFKDKDGMENDTEIGENKDISKRSPIVRLQEYTNRAKISRLQIPEKFSSQESIGSKDLKNFINSNKIESHTSKVHYYPILNSSNDDSISTNVHTEFNNNKEKQSKQQILKSETTGGNVRKILENYQPKHNPTPTSHVVKTGKLAPQRKEEINVELNVKQKATKHILQRGDVDENKSPMKQERIVENRPRQSIQKTHSLHSDTSPICNDHIVPEVHYSRMSVAEKRKIFAQSTFEGSLLPSNSLSSNESDNFNAEPNQTKKHLQFEGLSVLNVLGSLRNSTSSFNGQLHQNSTASLPNISDLQSQYIFPRIVREKKDFWEEVSSRSSSSLGTSSSPRNLNRIESERNSLDSNNWKHSSEDIPKLNTHKSADDLSSHISTHCSVDQDSIEDEQMNFSLPNMPLDFHSNTSNSLKQKAVLWEKDSNSSLSSDIKTEDVSDHLEKFQKLKDIWSKQENRISKNVNKTNGIYKSENNISTFKDKKSDSLKRFKSVEDFLDEYINVSIKERKNMLFQNNVVPQQFGKPNNDVKPVHSTKEPKPSVAKITNNFYEENRKNQNVSSCESNEDMEEDSPESACTSHVEIDTTASLSSRKRFTQAFKYFQKLEEKSIKRSISKKCKKPTDIKKLSLNLNRHLTRKLGGSLNLPTLSTRFAVSNVYDDVFGSGRRSFRGIPNRTAVVEALATFPRTDNVSQYKDELEDEIKFGLFMKRVKPKRRKSIKSVFDVFY